MLIRVRPAKALTRMRSILARAFADRLVKSAVCICFVSNYGVNVGKLMLSFSFCHFTFKMKENNSKR